jgi:hypothetical protein
MGRAHAAIGDIKLETLPGVPAQSSLKRIAGSFNLFPNCATNISVCGIPVPDAYRYFAGAIRNIPSPFKK